MLQAMLHLARGNRLEPWSDGCASFFFDIDLGAHKLPVAVRCLLGGRCEVTALLDTGAKWSVIGGETAASLAGALEVAGDTLIEYKTRFGTFKGLLHRVSIELIAESGNSLPCDATVLVIPEWPGPTVLGFRGFLEWVRIGLDPDDNQPMFYFGPRA